MSLFNDNLSKPEEDRDVITFDDVIRVDKEGDFLAKKNIILYYMSRNRTMSWFDCENKLRENSCSIHLVASPKVLPLHLKLVKNDLTEVTKYEVVFVSNKRQLYKRLPSDEDIKKNLALLKEAGTIVEREKVDGEYQLSDDIVEGLSKRQKAIYNNNCFHCGEERHPVGVNCRSKISNLIENKACFKCGKHGHSYRDCSEVGAIFCPPSLKAVLIRRMHSKSYDSAQNHSSEMLSPDDKPILIDVANIDGSFRGYNNKYDDKLNKDDDISDNDDNKHDSNNRSVGYVKDEDNTSNNDYYYNLSERGENYNQGGRRENYNQGGRRENYNQGERRENYNQGGRRENYNQNEHRRNYNQGECRENYNQDGRRDDRNQGGCSDNDNYGGSLDNGYYNRHYSTQELPIDNSSFNRPSYNNSQSRKTNFSKKKPNVICYDRVAEVQLQRNGSRFDNNPKYKNNSHRADISEPRFNEGSSYGNRSDYSNFEDDNYNGRNNPNKINNRNSHIPVQNDTSTQLPTSSDKYDEW